MKTIKWGFIGCGDVTERKSGPAFSNIANSTVVAVMSRNREKAKDYAVRHGIKRFYTDAQELIADPEVNAVYVATPPSSHSTYAIMAMKAGKPVYVEKPLASNYEDCVRVNKVSEETGIPCFVAYYRRALPYFQRVKQIIESGAIGNVMNVQVRYATTARAEDYGKEKPWRVQPEISGGGYFYDMASHQLDWLQYIFGVIVEARGIYANRAHIYDAEDTVDAFFEFENGIIGSGSWCFAAHESAMEDRIHLVGDKGSISFSVFNYEPISLYTSGGIEHIDIPNPRYVQEPMIKNVVDHLLGNDICTCTSVSATPVNWAMDRILGKF